jgi:hypothetical protein
MLFFSRNFSQNCQQGFFFAFFQSFDLHNEHLSSGPLLALLRAFLHGEKREMQVAGCAIFLE